MQKPDFFSGPVAERYDMTSEERFSDIVINQTVNVLAELAGSGRALEFGVGTGRLALPLSQRGVSIHGIDLSVDMIRQMQAKSGGDKISFTVGDFAHARVSDTFSLVYLVFNTIMNLTSQEEQVNCFCNASRHLTKDGLFLIEVGVPALRSLPPGQDIFPFKVTEHFFGFDLYDTVVQSVTSHHFNVGDQSTTPYAVPFRYVWPSELDLMAFIAGMRLEHRWADWDKNPFTKQSSNHVSVWRKI